MLEKAQEQLMQAADLTGGDSVVSEHLGDVLLLQSADVLELLEVEQPESLPSSLHQTSKIPRTPTSTTSTSSPRPLSMHPAHPIQPTFKFRSPR